MIKDTPELSPFKIGQPIPAIWLHAEFDLVDTFKYLEDRIILSKGEADRLTDKYWNARTVSPEDRGE